MKTVTKLNKNAENKLEKYIVKYLKDYTNDEQELESHISDILQYGCQSGAVSPLIYYSDTIPFFKKYQNEINQLLSELINDTGMPISELLQSFDDTDPLCLDTQNQNLMAWFGFEETLRNLCLKSEVLEGEI